jgi:acetyl-CoA carboxylase biotin carboxyl carrier protein
LLTFEQIKELIDLVTERRLQGVEIERAGFRMRIEGKRPAEIVHVESATVTDREIVPPRATAPAEPVSGPSQPPAEEASEAAESSLPEGAHVLHSPIVGTFYSAPSPDADPYVTTGVRVKKGQVLCIVEAMKLMNEIESDVSGELIEIYPRNAQPVEYGEPLFAILPS